MPTMVQVQGDSAVNKLILLFVFDKMEAPLSEDITLEICCSSNDWINYMDCKPLLSQLLEAGFLYEVSVSGKPLYTITTDGRTCLAQFFSKIPTSTRERISQFVKQNRLRYRKKQECSSDYFMNRDGTYTVMMKIVEPAQPILELKIVVPNRQTAKNLYEKWEDKSADVYANIYEMLVD